MKMVALKNAVYTLYGNAQQRRGYPFVSSSPIADRQFKPAIRAYGDLRRLQTWQSAFIDLMSQQLATEMNFEGQFLIEECLCNAPQRDGWGELVESIVDRLFLVPEAVKALAYGIHVIATMGPVYGASLEQIRALFNHEQRKLLHEYAGTFRQQKELEIRRVR
jgi:hypothetical protein